MSEQHASTRSISFSSFFVVSLFIIIDIFTMFLQLESKASSHFALAILTTQFLCYLVFLKGQICPGQRGRLSAVHNTFGIFWLVWLLLSLCSNQHYVLTDLVCLAGGAMVLCASNQPRDETLRRSMLIMGAIVGGLGVVIYGWLFAELNPFFWLSFNPFSQLLIGVFLCYFALLIAKNRLQGFIALLPLVAVFALLLSALVALGWLYYCQQQGGILPNQLALILYFVLHLILALLIAIPIFRKQTASPFFALVLLVLALSLPLWASFAYLV